MLINSQHDNDSLSSHCLNYFSMYPSPANTIMWLINEAINRCKWNTTVACIGGIKQINVYTNLIHEDVFLVFLWSVPLAINQKHIASLEFTGPALWSAICCRMFQHSPCLHSGLPAGMNMQFYYRRRLEEGRGERALEEEGVIWDNPVI